MILQHLVLEMPGHASAQAVEKTGDAEQDAKDSPSSSTGTAQESSLRQERSKYCAADNVDICWLQVVLIVNRATFLFSSMSQEGPCCIPA